MKGITQNNACPRLALAQYIHPTFAVGPEGSFKIQTRQSAVLVPLIQADALNSKVLRKIKTGERRSHYTQNYMLQQN